MAGRPKKNENHKKSERFQVQLTPDEVKYLGGRFEVYDLIQLHLNSKLKYYQPART